MKRLTFLLIFLLLSSQAEDAWAIAPFVPSAPLSDENDDYLPAQRQFQGATSVSHQPSAFNGLKLRTAHTSLVRNGVPSGRNLITPFDSPALYVFMSLQL
jgi:hypothetical protein